MNIFYPDLPRCIESICFIRSGGGEQERSLGVRTDLSNCSPAKITSLLQVLNHLIHSELEIFLLTRQTIVICTPWRRCIVVEYKNSIFWWKFQFFLPKCLRWIICLSSSQGLIRKSFCDNNGHHHHGTSTWHRQACYYDINILILIMTMSI